MTHFLNAFHKRPIGLWALIPLLSLLAAPAALADDFVCVGREDGTQGAGPFDNVIVPSGESCTLIRGVMVQGSVEVEPGGRLRALFGIVIQGNVKIGTGGDSIIFRSAVGGNVKARGAAFFRIGSSVVNGDVEVRESQLRPGAGMGGAPLFSSGVADNVIGGDLKVRENDGEIGFFIGTGEFPSGVQTPLDNGSTIGGDVEIEENGDFMGEGIVIGDNTIGGNLECEENAFVHPDPENPNTVLGNKEGQCSAGNGF